MTPLVPTQCSWMCEDRISSLTAEGDEGAETRSQNHECCLNGTCVLLCFSLQRSDRETSNFSRGHLMYVCVLTRFRFERLITNVVKLVLFNDPFRSYILELCWYLLMRRTSFRNVTGIDESFTASLDNLWAAGPAVHLCLYDSVPPSASFYWSGPQSTCAEAVIQSVHVVWGGGDVLSDGSFLK